MSISDEVEDQLEEEWGDKGEACFPHLLLLFPLTTSLL